MVVDVLVYSVDLGEVLRKDICCRLVRCYLLNLFQQPGNVVLKCLFLKYCMGFKVEMMVTLTQLGLIYLNFVRQGKTPHFFGTSGQGTSRDPRESGWVT